MALTAHFLDVGRGDCTIIEHDSGRVSIIDIDQLRVLVPSSREEMLRMARESRLASLVAQRLGQSRERLAEGYVRRKEAALTDPFDYLDQRIGLASAFRVVITHPDMDHMTGLHRLDDERAIVNFWHSGSHPFNLDDTTDEEWETSPYAKIDWLAYKRLRQSTSDPKNLRKYQGDQGQYWSDDGLELWAPTPALEYLATERDAANILSYVIKVTHAGTSIVLGGDATAEETWKAIYPSLNLSGISILKASHHGRKTGYYGPAVKEMSPWLTITSVGERAYDATENYLRYSDHTVSLRDAGDIRVTIKDDGSWVYSSNVSDHWKPKFS